MTWLEEFTHLVLTEGHPRWRRDDYEGVAEQVAEIYFGKHQGLEAPIDAFQRFLEVDKRIHSPS